MLKCLNFKGFRKKHGLYDLRSALAKWVGKNIGPEYVEEALEKYDNINQGIPIGGLTETVAFLDMVERVKKEMLEEKWQNILFRRKERLS